MFLKIKNRVEKELRNYALSVGKKYRINNLSPLLSDNIKEFILRDGKRVRPVLFCIGYLSFTKRAAFGLFKSAVSLELLHDFMLIHDDIIDKSDTRRGRPSMHIMLHKQIPTPKNLKFDGKDLAIVTGDVVYAMALDAFLSIKENPKRKELSLKRLISAALYTGSGEFIELLLGAKPIEKVTKNDIYKVYDYKTANYTFASPLTMGAILAGARKKQIKRLFEYGMCLGRAFQIKDDIIGIFKESYDIGKSNLTDLAEAKKTILIWHAYNNSKVKLKKIIKKILSGRKTSERQLKTIRKILLETGSLEYAKDEIKSLLNKSEKILKTLRINNTYRKALRDFANQTLKV